MILAQTDDYMFHLGGKSEILLWNVRDGRYEVWVEAPPGRGSLIWCRFETPLWYAFGRAAGNPETIAGSKVTFDDDGGFSSEF